MWNECKVLHVLQIQSKMLRLKTKYLKVSAEVLDANE